ncbi:MAG: hypothetical protein ACLFVJ_14155 [Persicimonas sp.]
MPQAPQITLRIDEIVLDGVSPADWRRIEDALRRELERLITEEGLPEGAEHSAEIDALDAGDVELGGGLLPDQIGRQLARSLYDELAGGGR